MKKNLLLVSIAYASIFTATSFLSGCQAIEGLFSESPTYRYRAPEPGSYRMHHHSTMIYRDGYDNEDRGASNVSSRHSSSGGSRSFAPKARYVPPSTARTMPSAPSEAESVITPVGKVSPTTTSSSAAVPTQAPAVPSVAPTVGQ